MFLVALLAAQLRVPPPADPSPHESRFIVANGVNLHYLDWGGDGEVLLFITGTGNNAHVFDGLAPRFTDHFHVMALTRRGHGQSERAQSGYDIPNLTEDVRSFLDLKGISRVNLVCHSAGGDETTLFATTYPNWIGKIVYLDAAYDRSDVAALEKLDPMPVDGPSSREQELHWQGMDAFRPEFNRIKAPVLNFYAYLEEHWAVDENTPPDLRRRAEHYMEDVVRPHQLRNIEQFRRDVPTAEVVVLRNTHHYFFRDPTVKESVVERMRTFLID